MNIFEAIVMGEAHRCCELMVFDWDKAARLIKERRPEIASAGLRDDWGSTGGTIYTRKAGPIVQSYTFLASTWAVPELDLDGDVIPCYRMKHDVPDWDYDTKWPRSALAILQEVKK